MDKLEEMLGKYDEFNTYLNGINLGELGRQYGRKELESFVQKLYGLKTRSLAYEISQLAEAMKEKEFPELLGVHHFPAIRQMDFLSNEEKIALDGFLVRFREGNYRTEC